MSKDNARKFLDAMNDKDAREAWNAKVAGVKDDVEALKAAVDIAKEMGYDITKEELTDALSELKSEQKERTQQAVQDVQELDLDDLEDVAGGTDSCGNPQYKFYADMHLFDCFIDNLCLATWH